MNWGSRNNFTAQGAFFGPEAIIARRSVLGFAAAGLAVALTGCVTNEGGSRPHRAGPPPANEGAVRALLHLASARAFAQLSQPDGFWNSPVAQIGLPVLFQRPGRTRNNALRSAKFRNDLAHRLNTFAEAGAKVARPLIERAIDEATFAKPDALLTAGRTAASSDLRQQMGPALVNTMIPALEQAMQASNDPVLARAMAAVSGVTITDAAHALALGADNAIWYEIGAAEGQVRDDPTAGGNAMLAAALHRR
ncbi:DUF4197 family protein [Novosphingobium sp. 9]|uniref:DUF4197 family protein n=1 Tax=Novosphingobium sp. 9 TaxID=2025349 RepID=UPI0021B52FBE|nr:DUF4197 family protein [Novosphingobium sp. 9]